MRSIKIDGHSHGHAGGLEDEQNLNVRAAYIHALGDLLQSLAVLVSGGLIWLAQVKVGLPFLPLSLSLSLSLLQILSFSRSRASQGWSSYYQAADPICTVIFAILVFWSSAGVFKVGACLSLSSPSPSLSLVLSRFPLAFLL